jgi:MFS family permease
MQSTILPYLAYRLTDKPFYLGLIGFASALPALVIMLPAGVYVERWDKRKTVVLMQVILMLQAFSLAYLALTGQITIVHILILSFIGGATSSIEMTARQAMIIELVGIDALPNGIALNSMIFNAARVIGPSLSAPFLVLLQNQGEGWAFLANGVSYLFVIAGLLMIRLPAHSAPQTLSKSMLADFKEGQAYIFKTNIIAMLIVLAGLFTFLVFPFTQQIPVFATDVFKTAADNSGSAAARNSLMVIAQGIGAFIAAGTLAYLSGIRRKGLMLVVGEGVLLAGVIGLALSRTIQVAFPCMIMIGWGTVTSLALTNTLIQLIVPDELRGRVLSTYLWSSNGISLFGSLLIGWWSQSWGASVAVLIGGLACVAVTVAVHVANPFIRRYTV